MLGPSLFHHVRGEVLDGPEAVEDDEALRVDGRGAVEAVGLLSWPAAPTVRQSAVCASVAQAAADPYMK